MSFVPLEGAATFAVARPPRDSAVGFTGSRHSITLPMRGAIPVLSRGLKADGAHPSVSLLSAATLLALQLVAAGRVRRTEADDGWRIGPLQPADEDRVRALAEARAYDGLAVEPAEQLVRDVLDAVADAITPQQHHPSQAGPRPRSLAEARAQRASKPPGSRPWQRHPTEPDDDLPDKVELSLRVEAPLEQLEAGRLIVVLQVHEAGNTGHLTDAEQLWLGSGHGFSPKARLAATVALREAAMAWPPLQRLLRQRVPDRLELDDEELADLIEEGVAALGRQGVDVFWPRGLRADLTAHARVEATSRDQKKPIVEGLFSPAGLFEFDWRLALRGEPLTDGEMKELAEATSPVIRLRDNWVVVDPGTLRRARKRRGPREIKPVDALRASLTGQLEVDGVPVEVHPGAMLEKIRGRITDASLIAPFDPPPGLHAELRDYQRRGFTWLAQLTGTGLGACLADDMGLGKGSPLSTRILTPAGWTTYGEVQVGDRIIGSDGVATMVTGVYPRGRLPVYRVTFSDGASVVVDGDHLWTVHSAQDKRGGRLGRTLSTRQLMQESLHTVSGSRKNSRFLIPLVDPVEFDPGASLPLDPYLLGLLLGDGCFRQDSPTFSTGDAELLGELVARLPAGCSVRPCDGRGVDFRIAGPGGQFTVNPVKHALRGLGLDCHGSGEKFVPPQYLYAAPEERLALLQGLADTDGTVGVAPDIVTTSERLAQDIVFLVQSLGGIARLSTRYPTFRDKGGAKRLGRLAYRVGIKMPSHMNPFRLRRKADAWAAIRRTEPVRAIRSIEPAGHEEVVCISVSAADRLYVTEDFIVTHNTIQVIALHLHRRDRGLSTGPTLVVCPASLLGNWEAEIRRFAPGVEVRRHHASARDLSALEQGFVLTTYGTMRRDHELLGTVPWDLVVADEAQHVKNPTSSTARNLRTIGSRCRVALTGTPVENDLTELWAILDWATPGLLGSRNAFRKTWAAPIESGVDPSVARRFAQLVEPFLLRRRKSDPGIAPELPSKTETDRIVDLTKEQVVLYETLVRESMRRIEEADEQDRRGLVLALLTGLKQICNHPAHYLRQANGRVRGRSGKVELLDELLGTILAEDGAVLLFTQYVEMGRLLERHLADQGIPTLFLHGGTPVRERERMVAAFQAGEVPVFLLSLKAGGTGLNLTRADHVVHVDRWWNPAVEDQATDRAHRIGQTRPVQVHRLVSSGTLEERIAELLDRKRSIAESVLGHDEVAITELSDAELRELVWLRRHD